MIEKRISRVLYKIISIGIFLTSTAIAPQILLDPINLPKMILLICTAFSGFGYILFNLKLHVTREHKTILVLIGLEIMALIITLIVSGQNLAQALFGTYGRNTGFFTYVSFSIILYLCAIVTTPENLVKVIKLFLITGLVAGAYGFFQKLGIEPANWDTYANPMVGFLGNTDFESALLGIAAVCSFGNFIYSKNRPTGYIFLTVGFLMLSYLTDARQGLVAFLLGSSCYLLVLAIQKKSRLIIFFFYLIGALSSIAIILGLLNSGIFGSLIFKTSLEARFYYWQAAIRMFMSHPLSGVGLDAFGDWYGRYRTKEAAAWNLQPTNVAHNVFLDYAANGGILLLLINLLFVTLVLNSFRHTVIKQGIMNYQFIILFACWVAFQAQSLISINQIGLSVWNWVFSGFLIGFRAYGEVDSSKIKNRAKVSSNLKIIKERNVSVSAFDKNLLGFFIGGLVAIILIFPMTSASARYWAAIKSANLDSIVSATYFPPLDEYRFMMSIVTLNNTVTQIRKTPQNQLTVAESHRIDNLEKEAFRLSKNGVRYFPKSRFLWLEYSKNPYITTEELKRAKAAIKLLDPFNPIF